MPNTNNDMTLRIRNLAHVATQLHIDLPILLHIAKNTPQYYIEFEKNVKGKTRTLVMAQKELAAIQKRILARILCRLPICPHAYGAIKGRSIKGNASAHAKAPYIIKLDIRDFYPSIRYKKVYNFFINQECTPDVSRLLTLLTTRNHSLPLGVSTSPMLADQIVRAIDIRISGMATKAGLTYTRYVDDITISGNFPVKPFAELVMTIIRQAGFRIKRNKLEMYEPGDGKERIITGVGVHQGSTFVPKSYFESLQSELLGALEQSQHQNAIGHFDTRQQYLGKIGYVRWIDPNAGQELLRIYRKVKWRHLEWVITRQKFN